MQHYGMFCHLGPMRSSKSERLIKNALYFIEKGFGQKVVCFKVCPGSEEAKTYITTRASSDKVEAHVITESTRLIDIVDLCHGATHIFVDEQQFLKPSQLKIFMDLSGYAQVYLYGLMYDFLGKPFDNALALIEEYGWNNYSLSFYKADCEKCEEPATRNMLVDEHGVVRHADSTILVGDTQFVTCCKRCFEKYFNKGVQI